MNAQALKIILMMSTLGLGSVTLMGCQQESEPSTESVQNEAVLPLIQAHTEKVTGVQSLSCEKEGCTRYDLQSVKTNVDWIDQYFYDRIKRAEPVAFKVNQAKQESEVDVNSLDQRNIRVGYLGQQANLATFVMKSYQFKTGSEFGMYHHEYVNFDLTQKKRLALEDILKKGVDAKLLDQLYDANMLWLQAHDIEKAQLKLSDNFYINAQGLVLVYPLYEMADYTTGMPELKIPHDQLAALLKPEYLPNLAQQEMPKP
ncbi:hypothetical protein A3K93_08835 [Acinetobacter sp. NCu2D-2]|uniref:RsiV family protein n=1 Tax=Acinetobacter sp. NCu2D-2 TaxID=1608473 RepID=UPI0007CDF095|nr:RsiV family protein [Acinetobacter sp. NCu2D-2]ANF82287.1 hypothetical protein A3K93_08835 [Acinetobacter sp. NCu2D-2]